jgi:hypothetical protein
VGGVVVGALTAGVGLLAGMMVVGMGGAAAGSAAVMSSSSSSKERNLILASSSYEDAEGWVTAIENAIMELGDTVYGLSSASHRRMTLRGNRSTTPHPEVRIDEIEDWLHNTRWKACDTYAGLRLFEPCYEEEGHHTSSSAAANTSSFSSSYDAFFNANTVKQVDIQIAPCLRVNIDVNTTPSDAFASIMLFGTSTKSGVIQTVRIIENLDNQTDIIHLKFSPVFLFPTWTGKIFFFVGLLVYLFVCASLIFCFFSVAFFFLSFIVIIIIIIITTIIAITLFL